MRIKQSVRIYYRSHSSK